MGFSPADPVVQLCLQGLGYAERGLAAEASSSFQQAWAAATQDYQRFIAAFHLARDQKTVPERLQWFETALETALTMDDASVKSAFRPLYEAIARCHEDLGDPERAQEALALAASLEDAPSDRGPFYHGTKADLKAGERLVAGAESNYQAGLKMNHIYFTALANGAGLAAALAKGEGQERVYVVEPTGPFEDDPNVTNKKFPGNPTRSYRSEAPLKVVGELKDWERPAPEELERFRGRLAKNKGEIIN